MAPSAADRDLQKRLKEAEARLAQVELEADEHRKRAEKLEKKLKDATTKPTKIPAPKGTAGRTVNGYELAKAMRLDGTENNELLNRLKALVRYLFPKYLTVTGTYATYKDTNKLNAAVEAIASEVPYFRRYEGLWPIHQILRSFLQNNNSRLKTALLQQKSYEEGTEVPERRKGRKRKDEGVDDGAEGIDADEEDEEMEDEEKEEEETVKTVPPKKKPAPSKPAPLKPARSKPAASKPAASKSAPSKSAPSKSATSHKTKAINKPRKRKDDSDEEDEGWNTEFETDSEGWESAKESDSGGEDVMDSQVQLRSAQWSHDETNNSQPTKLRRSARDIPKKTVSQMRPSPFESASNGRRLKTIKTLTRKICRSMNQRRKSIPNFCKLSTMRRLTSQRCACSSQSPHIHLLNSTLAPSNRCALSVMTLSRRSAHQNCSICYSG
ncbi:hypothetical protein C8F01DRAFT_1180321 [Mycena amicta]|nr:hypothetical protein C8F01DRAFT_1180321 [Mycena amicta]